MEEERGNVPGKSLPAPIALPISFGYRQSRQQRMAGKGRDEGVNKNEKDRERETGLKKEKLMTKLEKEGGIKRKTENRGIKTDVRDVTFMFNTQYDVI